MRILAVVTMLGGLGFAWLAQSAPAGAETRHLKHRPVRTTVYPYYYPYIERPPGYIIGGPNYTACDRMNHDRMLVGRRC